MTTRAEQLIDDLNSADEARVASAIEGLEHLMLALDTDPLPPPSANVLDVLGLGDHDDLIASYLTVLGSYPFDPPLDAPGRTLRAIDAVLKHGRSYAARQLSLHLVNAPRYGGPSAALDHIARRGVEPGQEAEEVGWLLSYLLDDPGTRSATVAALARWRKHPVLSAVLDLTRDRLDADEQAALNAGPNDD